MPRFAQGGDVCPSTDGPDDGKPQRARQTTLAQDGLTHAGRQRSRGNACGRTFAETPGTRFDRRRPSAADLLETLALIAEGSRVSSSARVTGPQEDTSV
jgi:hypothetical protein